MISQIPLLGKFFSFRFPQIHSATIMKAAQLFEFNIYIDILESFLWPKEYVDEKNKVFIRYFIN